MAISTAVVSFPNGKSTKTSIAAQSEICYTFGSGTDKTFYEKDTEIAFTIQCAYVVIQECSKGKGYPIEAACSLLHVARSAYHKWASGKLSRRIEENERLADTIEKIHEESPDKGYRRLNDDLRHDYGIHVNDKRVLRICRARDIKSTIKYANHGCTRRAKNPQYVAVTAASV